MNPLTIDIIPFEPEYAPHFYTLNVAWLEKYFYVEPYDEKVLSNPKEYILKNGGFIFFRKNKHGNSGNRCLDQSR